jgi:hypothetical protein
VFRANRFGQLCIFLKALIKFIVIRGCICITSEFEWEDTPERRFAGKTPKSSPGRGLKKLPGDRKSCSESRIVGNVAIASISEYRPVHFYL